MKVVILAAGIGSRLRPLTEKVPKAMVPCKGKPLLDYILNALSSLNIEEYIIVTGYLSKIIEDYLKPRKEKFTFIYNEKFDTAGNAYSLLKAKKHVLNQSFFKIDSDLIFVPEIANRLLEAPGDIRLSVDIKDSMGDEEMKIKVDQNGKIINLSKEIVPEEALGESIGIEFISEKGSQPLFEELEKMMNEGLDQEYYEEAYGRLARKNYFVTATEVLNEHKWIEIDNHNDLNEAEKLFGK
jgi:choline kinase